MWLQSLGGEDALEEGTAPPPVFLAGESHGQRSLGGCSPRGRRESDTTERLDSNEWMVLCRLSAGGWVTRQVAGTAVPRGPEGGCVRAVAVTTEVSSWSSERGVGGGLPGLCLG